MRTRNITFLIVLFSLTAVKAQLSATVVDFQTKSPIPYVNIWVEGKNLGTTSDLEGKFELKVNKRDTIVFSAIGFETLKLPFDSIDTVVAMQSGLEVLDEIVVREKRSTKSLTIGKYKKSKINSYFGTNLIPWIAARFFPYDSIYDKTPFIDNIRLNTKSDIRDAKFSIRLYALGSNGQPDGYIHDGQIIGIAKKGSKNTTVDLSDLKIQFPEEGFFVAFEWLIIEDNLYSYTYTKKGSAEKFKGYSYEPAIGTVPYNSPENSWSFVQGAWRVTPSSRSRLNKGELRYNLIAMELTLTN